MPVDNALVGFKLIVQYIILILANHRWRYDSRKLRDLRPTISTYTGYISNFSCFRPQPVGVTRLISTYVGVKRSWGSGRGWRRRNNEKTERFHREQLELRRCVLAAIDHRETNCVFVDPSKRSRCDDRTPL